MPKGWLATNNPTVVFEDNAIGRMKKEIWESSEEEIDAILEEYGMPSPVEWGIPGSYLQMIIRHKLVEERRKNDIVFIPIGCTELHGEHTVSATDTLFVSQIAEGVRRYTKAKGYPVAISLPPLNFGAHPYHHYGMAGTAPIREDIAREMLIDVMLGLWNDGFRKQIFLNNHGHLWMLESTIQQFQHRWIHIADQADGRKGKVISPSRSSPRPRVSWATPRTPRHGKPNALWQPSCAT
jgi:creatinine amidohydrolase